MSDKLKFDERFFWNLQAAHDAAMDDIGMNQRVYDAVTVALGRIAQEHYPGLGNWKPEQLRMLGDVISQHACKFAVKLSDLNFDGHAESGPSA